MSAPLCDTPTLPTLDASDDGGTCVDTLALSRGNTCRARPWHYARRSRSSVQAPRFWPSICDETPAIEYENLPAWLVSRPTKRAECPPPEQQCPWVSCRYHLALDAAGKKRPRVKVWTHPYDWTPDTPTCALHVAARGANTLDEVGTILGDISRERIRQIEQAALAKLAPLGIVPDLAADFGLDGGTRAPRHRRPAAEGKGHHTNEWRPRSTDPELDGTYTGPFRSQDMTAKMRRIQVESAPPVRSVTLPPEEIARIEASIRAKQAPPRANATNARVTSDTFTVLTHDPRSPARYARSRDSLQSYRRLTRDDAPPPAKAPPTTTPRKPSPPSPSPLEIPPQDPPALSRSDDHPEAAVATALPDPAPQEKPMPYPPSRKANAPYAQRAAVAITEILYQRRMTRAALVDACAAAYPAIKASSIGTSILSALSATGSPVSVWYRRIAAVLGVELSALCDVPEWLEQVQQEGSPRVTCHAPPSNPPPHPQAPPSIPPPPAEAPPLPTPDTSTIIPLLAEAIRQAQAADLRAEKRAAEQAAVIDLLRHECDDLRQQLADATKARDAAASTLADIRKRLG